MDLWLGFIGGVIIGWLIEWVVDWYYWRRGVAQFYATEGELRRQLATAQAQNEELQARLQQAQDETATLRAQLGLPAPEDTDRAPTSTHQEGAVDSE